MAASDDLQFDLSAALVAAMIVLYELAIKDVKTPQTPSPGMVSVEILFSEQALTVSERGSFSEFQILGKSFVADPFPEFKANNGTETDSAISCSFVQSELKLSGVYESDRLAPPNQTLRNGEPVDTSLTLQRFGARYSTNNVSFHATSDVDPVLAFSMVGAEPGLQTPLGWPSILSDRGNNGWIDLAASDDSEPVNILELAGGSCSLNPFLANWCSVSGTSDALQTPQRIQYTPLVGPELASAAPDPWLLTALLPFRPIGLLKCEMSGDSIRSSHTLTVNFESCSAGPNPCDEIRPVNILGVRVLSSYTSGPVTWSIGDDFPSSFLTSAENEKHIVAGDFLTEPFSIEFRGR